MKSPLVPVCRKTCSTRVRAFILVVIMAGSGMMAQEDLHVVKTAEDGWLNFTDASNSLYHFLAAQSYNLLAERSRHIAGLQSESDWMERQDQVSKALLKIVGPFPEKTPLNAKIVRTLIKLDYKVEHIVFESRPGFYVTSSLFMPLVKGKMKSPAVIYCSGHTYEGYRSAAYQHVILNLVKKGLIVLAIDPVGQGERVEYLDPQTGKPSMGGTTNEHSYAGAQAFISGSSYARYMIWDGIRAIDYLLGRKEVDPSRIGITGRSGGGTQSALIAAMDDRIFAAAPECYITSFTRLLQSIGPQDAEQNLVHEIADGIDLADLLSVRAPRPALMLTTTRDFFSIQGAREAAEEIRRIYKAYGKEENFDMVEDDAPHQSTLKNREALYAFFQKNFNIPGSPDDHEVVMLTPEEMKVTATGQVATSYQGETVFSINRMEALEALDQQNSGKSDGDFTRILNSARQLSGYREPGELNNPVFAGRFRRNGYCIEKYFVSGESDYIIPYLLMIPDNPNHKGILYIQPAGKSADAAPGGEMEWFVMKGFTILAPDLIGTGETGPGDFQGDSYIEGHSYNIWFAALLIGRSITGVQAGDVIRLARQLKDQTAVSEIYGLAYRESVPVLLHAAAFDPVISRIGLVEPYSSYRSLVLNRFYDPRFILGSVAGSIGKYDLPDLSASLAPRKLMMIGITDCMGHPIAPEDITEDLTRIRDAYHATNADDQLGILQDKQDRKSYYLEWIK